VNSLLSSSLESLLEESLSSSSELLWLLELEDFSRCFLFLFFLALLLLGPGSTSDESSSSSEDWLDSRALFRLDLSPSSSEDWLGSRALFFFDLSLLLLLFLPLSFLPLLFFFLSFFRLKNAFRLLGLNNLISSNKYS